MKTSFNPSINGIELLQGEINDLPYILLKRNNETVRYDLNAKEYVPCIITKAELSCAIALVTRTDIGFFRLVKFKCPKENESLADFSAKELVNTSQIQIPIHEKLSEADLMKIENHDKSTRDHIKNTTTARFSIIDLVDISLDEKELLVKVSISRIELNDSGLAFIPSYSYKCYDIEKKELYEIYRH